MFLIILRKASLDRRPISIIRYTGSPPRNMAMAAPDQIECVLTSSALIFSTSSPIAHTALRRAPAICFDVS
jgi:hypothetical protein